jgi:predicted lipid-binding transport protein (Tim44 family)
MANGAGANNYRQPPAPINQSQGGGFMRNMAGAVAGGFLGSMLFSGVSRAFNGSSTPSGTQPLGTEGSTNRGRGGGIGLLEILLFGGLAYLGYRFWKGRQEKLAYDSGSLGSSPVDSGVLGSTPQDFRSYRSETTPFLSDPSIGPVGVPVETYDPRGAGGSRTLESLSEPGSAEQKQLYNAARDIFYRVQTAWSRRDLSGVRGLLAPGLKASLETDLEDLTRSKKFNRLENISITDLEIVKAWEEPGEICCSVKITAYLLDYMVDEGSQQVMSGSNQEPVRFEEIWTFSKPQMATTTLGVSSSADGWVLAGIEQLA